jgi:uncharacterized membrane protein
MPSSTFILLLAAGIGFVAGLRSLTAPAVVSWAAHLGWLNLQGTQLELMGSTAAVAIFSILAVAEMVTDKLPRTPNRTTAGPLIARIVTGSLSGAALGVAAGVLLSGMVLGGIGAIIGAFTGYQIRRRVVRGLGGKDIIVALTEDAIAVGLALLVVSSTK